MHDVVTCSPDVLLEGVERWYGAPLIYYSLVGSDSTYTSMCTTAKDSEAL